MTEPHPALPPVSDALRAQAAKSPGSWIYAIDPHFDPSGRVPPFGIIGAWKADDNGQLTEEFRPNPRYRPSPQARGMKAPTDRLEAAIQLAATGYISDGDMQAALLGSVVYTAPDSPGLRSTEPFTVAIYTSPVHAPSDVPEVQRVLFRDVLTGLPDHAIVKLNPQSPVSAEVAVTDIRRTPES
ncbi:MULTISPECIES: type VII secretion system-associated protein [Streptomyces]|uniref:type VII secretion system-associated protein n=1 Tax=Streptomyces TaxID=1883 RepID=UPI001FE562A4|nr:MULTISPECIES: type VII secretion system-associated protein [Streptomyces]